MNFLVSVMDVDVPHTAIAAHNSCMQSKPTKRLSAYAGSTKSARATKSKCIEEKVEYRLVV